MSNFLSLQVRRVSKRRIELPKFAIDYWPWMEPEPKCWFHIPGALSLAISQLQIFSLPLETCSLALSEQRLPSIFILSLSIQPSSKDFIPLLHCLHLWCPSLPTEYSLCCLNISLPSGSFPGFRMAEVMIPCLETL